MTGVSGFGAGLSSRPIRYHLDMAYKTRPELTAGDHFYGDRWWRHSPSGQRQPLVEFDCRYCGKPSRGTKARSEYCNLSHAALDRARLGLIKGAPPAKPGTTYTRSDGYVFVAINAGDRFWETCSKRSGAKVGWIQGH